MVGIPPHLHSSSRAFLLTGIPPHGHSSSLAFLLTGIPPHGHSSPLAFFLHYQDGRPAFGRAPPTPFSTPYGDGCLEKEPTAGGLDTHAPPLPLQASVGRHQHRAPGSKQHTTHYSCTGTAAGACRPGQWPFGTAAGQEGTRTAGGARVNEGATAATAYGEAGAILLCG